MNKIKGAMLAAGLASFVLLAATPSAAINNGAAVANAAARPPHVTVGAAIWQNGPVPLQEPCTAVLMCENVILTAIHCLNFNPQGDIYFTLVEDVNGLAGPVGEAQPTRYQKVGREFGRAGQTTTVRIDKNSVRYGEDHAFPVGPNQSIPAGLAMAKFKGTDALAGLGYPNLVPQNFALRQDPNAFAGQNPSLNPGMPATPANVSGYGDHGAERAGAGTMKKGRMRFLSWISGRNGLAQGMTAPAANSVNGFLLQFSRGRDAGNVHPCAGDSGGPAFFGGAKSDRLGGILDIISDRRCTNRHPLRDAAPDVPHIGNYVSLIYSPNRTFVQNYMNANCSDRRSINLKTGDNYVRAQEEEEQEEEDWTCTPDPDALSKWPNEDYYYDFLEAWFAFTVSIFPDYEWFPIVPPDPSVFPSPAPVYCESSDPTPEPSPTSEPSPEPTPELSPTPEPSPEPTPELSPTPEPSPEPTPELSPTPEPSSAAELVPDP